MGNYVRFGTPWVNGSGTGISAAFLTALENALIQPSGGSETGKYFIGVGAYTSGVTAGQYISSISRTTVPVGVTKDTTDGAPSGGTTVSTAHVSHSGFQIYTAANAANTNLIYGGGYTINY